MGIIARMTVELAPPRNISPLIRAGRWTFFLGGVWYGYSHFQSLKKYDEPLRKAAIEKATRDHKTDLSEKARVDKEGMLALAKEAGVCQSIDLVEDCGQESEQWTLHRDVKLTSSSSSFTSMSPCLDLFININHRQFASLYYYYYYILDQNGKHKQ